MAVLSSSAATGISSSDKSEAESVCGRSGSVEFAVLPLDIIRVLGFTVAAVLSSLNATHSVSNIKESTAMAPMSNERCKSIVIESVLNVSASRGARDQLHPRAMDGIWIADVQLNRYLLVDRGSLLLLAHNRSNWDKNGSDYPKTDSMLFDSSESEKLINGASGTLARR